MTHFANTLLENRIQRTNNFLDEYVISDLHPHEFDVIINRDV